MMATPFGSIKESFLSQDLPAHCMSLINGLCVHECSDVLDSVVLSINEFLLTGRAVAEQAQHHHLQRGARASGKAMTV